MTWNFMCTICMQIISRNMNQIFPKWRYMPPDKSLLLKIISKPNIRCGYSKEPSQWDGSFEHPKHMFKLMDKKIIAISCWNILINWPYEINIASTFGIICHSLILITSLLFLSLRGLLFRSAQVVCCIYSSALQTRFYCGSKHYESWSDCSLGNM